MNNIENKYYENIKELIEDNLVYEKKQEISVNHNRLLTYHGIGKVLIEAQGGEKRAKYGDGLLFRYAALLEEKYGNKYNITNLKRMRQFYLLFPKGAPVVHQLNWTHYLILLPIKGESKRNYYINSTIEHNFSKRQLAEYIKSNA